MPTCSAKGCFNSSRKGSSMCYFPKDPDRKKKWLDNCCKLGGMHDWKPLESAALCEHHFINESWEKIREDGKKKLKISGVPTLFGIFVKQVNKTTSKENSQQKKNKAPTKKNEASILKKCNKATEDLNKNRFIIKNKTTLANQQNSISKKLNGVNKNLMKNNISKKCRDNFEDQNKNSMSKKCKEINKNLMTNSTSKFVNNPDEADVDPDKQPEILEDLNENIVFNKSTEVSEEPNKKLKEISEDLSGKTSLDECSVTLENLNEISNKGTPSKNCKQIHEDLDIAKIISQPSLEDRINYSNLMKNKKIQSKPEILVYTLQDEKIGVSKRNPSPDSRLATYDLCLNFVDKKTIDNIISKNHTSIETGVDDYSIKEDSEFSDKDLNHEEKGLLELQKFYKILEPGLHSEQRCGIMQKMFEKSLNLRKIIEIQFRKREKNMRNYIKKLKHDLFLAHVKSLGIYSNLHRSQIYFKNGQRKRVRQWNDRAIKYAIKLKSSCGNQGYKQLLNQEFLLPSLRTLRRKVKEN